MLATTLDALIGQSQSVHKQDGRWEASHMGNYVNIFLAGTTCIVEVGLETALPSAFPRVDVVLPGQSELCLLDCNEPLVLPLGSEAH